LLASVWRVLAFAASRRPAQQVLRAHPEAIQTANRNTEQKSHPEP